MKGELDALFKHGDTVAGQLVPAREYIPEKSGGNARHDSHNEIFYDGDRADVCLNCPLPTCHGTRKCFRAMRDHPEKKIARMENSMKPMPEAKKKGGKRKKSDPLDLDMPDFDFDLPDFDFDLPEIDFDLPEIDFDLPDFDFDLPDFDFDLPEIDLDLPEIDINPEK